MLWQAQGVTKCFCSLGILLLLIEEVTVKVPGIEPRRRKFDGLLQQLASFYFVSEADWETRHAIIEHAKAGRSTCIELGRSRLVGLFQDIARAFGKAKGRKHAGHGGTFTGDDAVPYLHLNAIGKSRG